MTEQEAWDDPEMKVILLLSGYARELGEGKDFETTTYKTAKQIVKLFAIPDVVRCTGCNSANTKAIVGKVTYVCNDCNKVFSV